MVIRPFQEQDLKALYAISLATGFKGGDASHLYSDPKLIGHIYSAPYALLNPGLALVIEDADGVAGFAVGAIDTIHWEKLLEESWWPSLRKQYVDPSNIAAESLTQDQRRALMIHHPALTPLSISMQYPAHLHMNLLPRLQGRGLGSKLFKAWLNIANSQGVKKTHAGVNRNNTNAIRFWKKQGFEEIINSDLAEGRTLWMGRDC